MKINNVNGRLTTDDGGEPTAEQWQAWQRGRLAADMARLESEQRAAGYDARMGAGVQWNRACRATTQTVELSSNPAVVAMREQRRADTAALLEYYSK